jgi:hypothetical protein
MLFKFNRKRQGINTNSILERAAVLEFLLSNGYLWHGEPAWNPSSIHTAFSHNIYPVVTVDRVSKSLAGANRRHSINIKSFQQFRNLLFAKGITI